MIKNPLTGKLIKATGSTAKQLLAMHARKEIVLSRSALSNIKKSRQQIGGSDGQTSSSMGALNALPNDVLDKILNDDGEAALHMRGVNRASRARVDSTYKGSTELETIVNTLLKITMPLSPSKSLYTQMQKSGNPPVLGQKFADVYEHLSTKYYDIDFAAITLARKLERQHSIEPTDEHIREACAAVDLEPEALASWTDLFVLHHLESMITTQDMFSIENYIKHNMVETRLGRLERLFRLSLRRKKIDQTQFDALNAEVDRRKKTILTAAHNSIHSLSTLVAFLKNIDFKDKIFIGLR